MTVFQDNVSG